MDLLLNSSTHNWTLSFTHPVTGKQHRVPATVPGNVELDLRREGFITDPYPPDNPNAMQEWEPVDDWTYETAFHAPATPSGARVQLVFEGVDTIADVFLNGRKVLRCENMFIPHFVDITHQLQSSGNTLRVRIYSPVLWARQFQYDAFVTPSRRHDSVYLRKARHMWGWDNAPRLLSAGLWRGVRLEVQPPIRFEHVYLYT